MTKAARKLAQKSIEGIEEGMRELDGIRQWSHFVYIL